MWPAPNDHSPPTQQRIAAFTEVNCQLQSDDKPLKWTVSRATATCPILNLKFISFFLQLVIKHPAEVAATLQSDAAKPDDVIKPETNFSYEDL